MNKEEWEKFVKVFKVNVDVEVEKQVSRIDIISTLISEGEFIFKGKNGSFTSMKLDHLKGKATKEQISFFEDVLWKQVVEYLKIEELKKEVEK